MQYRNVNGDPVEPVKEFDLLDEDRPRDGGFVSIGEVARPMVHRLAEHLVSQGVIEDADRPVK
jgi:hypothetical protein